MTPSPTNPANFNLIAAIAPSPRTQSSVHRANFDLIVRHCALTHDSIQHPSR
jgi:hypothetical protein